MPQDAATDHDHIDEEARLERAGTRGTSSLDAAFDIAVQDRNYQSKTRLEGLQARTYSLSSIRKYLFSATSGHKANFKVFGA